MKDKLVFDVTDADTIAASDSVGAFLRSSDGTLITHSTVGGKEALDVSIADGVNVEVDLSHIDDSVSLGDGATLFTGTTVGADHGLDVNIINASISIDDGGGSITVDAIDLDIRDLAFATDSVTAHQGGTWTIDSITNPVAVTDNGGSLTVDAVDFDIRDLTAVSDSVASHLYDGAGTALTSTLVGADQALDVNVVASEELTVNDAALANTAIASAANSLALANTAEDVVASPLANRKYLYIYNNSNKQVFIGQSGVSAASGFPLSPSSVMELRAGAAVDIEFVGASAGQELRTLELS
jgi:hypothetical protein